MRELGPRIAIAVSAIASVFIVVAIVIFAVRSGNNQNEGAAADGTFMTGPPSERASPFPAVGTTAAPTVTRSRVPLPTPPLTGHATAEPTTTPTAEAPVPFEIDSTVAQTWRDSLGTVRVHVVVSATNPSRNTLSLAGAERSFRLTTADGRTVQSGRFAYAFPFVVGPGQSTYLITTIVLPLGVTETGLGVETDLLGDVTTAVSPTLEVSGLSLESREGRAGVTGVVRNARPDAVQFGVVAVIGRDASGELVGGWYDNVHAASIPAGGEVAFATEYPGLPPDVVDRIGELTGVAFDVGGVVPPPG